MPRRCCVGGCDNFASVGPNVITLHTFPRDTVVRDQWINAIKSTGTCVSRGGAWNGPKLERTWNSQLVCSDHFLTELFTLTTRLHWQSGLPYKATLEKDAVPTLFGEQIAEYRSRDSAMRPAYRKREANRIISEHATSSSTDTCTSPANTNGETAQALATLASNRPATTVDDEALHILAGLACGDVTGPPVQLDNAIQPDGQVMPIQNQHLHLAMTEQTYISTMMQTEPGMQTDKVMPPKVQTSVKRVQTNVKDWLPLSTRGTQYTVNDFTDPHQVSSSLPRPMTSTPSRVQATAVHFDSPGLNSTYTSIATDNMANDPDYLPDESHVSDDAAPDFDRKDPQDARKFVVFEENLMDLFQVCPRCHGVAEAEVSNVIGTFVTVSRVCSCGFHDKWNSQPMFGNMPAGNVLLSAAILYAGCSASKVLRLFSFFNLLSISLNTFWTHQRKYLWPTIERVWMTSRTDILRAIRNRGQDVTVAGDGRADSPGHCAKYGAYSLIDMVSGKVIDVQLVQSNEVKSSYHMELEGLKRAVNGLTDEQIHIMEIITDRHLQIQKWIRENMTGTKHSYDVWHIAKAIKKKLLAIAKEKDCDVVYKWVKSITNHIYWSACSSTDAEMIGSKWESVANHIQNKHDDHDGPFNKCVHETLTKRAWLKPGSKACSKLEVMLLNPRLVKDVKKMSTGFQTSTLEAFHSVINQFAPKMTVYSFHGQLCRQHIAAMHFNENVNRPKATTKAGQPRVKVSFPKYKSGDDFSVKLLSEKMTFAYVTKLMCEVVKVCRGDITITGMETPAPPPLTSGKNKPTKREALAVLNSRTKKAKKTLEDLYGV